MTEIPPQEVEAGPRMIVFAGPNGSGKSTVTDGLKLDEEFPGVYINADDIARTELGHIPDPTRGFLRHAVIGVPRLGFAFGFPQSSTRRTQRCVVGGGKGCQQTGLEQRNILQLHAREIHGTHQQAAFWPLPLDVGFVSAPSEEWSLAFKIRQTEGSFAGLAVAYKILHVLASVFGVFHQQVTHGVGYVAKAFRSNLSRKQVKHLNGTVVNFHEIALYCVVDFHDRYGQLG